MSRPPLFFIIVIGLIVVFAAFRFAQQRREKADNDSAPQQQKSVVVSSKREKPLTARSRQQQVTPAGTAMRYEVSFKPQTGGLEMRFRLDEQQYNALTVGDRGVLRYQGSRFVDFMPQAAR